MHTSNSDNTWQAVEFLQPSIYGRVIGNKGSNLRRLEKQFDVKIRKNKKTNKLEIRGTSQNVSIAEEHLRMKYVNQNLAKQTSAVQTQASQISTSQTAVTSSTDHKTSVEIILNSTWDDFTNVAEEIRRNKSSLESEYGVSITINEDMNEISAEGPKENRIRLTLHLYEMMIVRPPIGARKTFRIGYGQKSILRQPNNHSLYRIPGFQDMLLEALKKTKIKIQAFPESICYIMLHGGKVRNDENRYHQSQYKRLESDDLNINSMLGFQHVRKLYRYDLTIYTPHPPVKLRYKLYLDANHSKFITCKEAGDRKPSFANIPVGPGYFEYPDEKFVRLDIVDPANGLATRISVSICQRIPEAAKYCKRMNFHLNVLQGLLDNIKIDNQSFDISLPEMPVGYIASFLRRSERNEYKSRQYRSTVVTTSVEKILKNSESYQNTDVIDIFFKDHDILDTLDSTDWYPEDILKRYEIVLKRGHDCLQNCLNHSK